VTSINCLFIQAAGASRLFVFYADDDLKRQIDIFSSVEMYFRKSIPSLVIWTPLF
jgi:hypothetical protein